MFHAKELADVSLADFLITGNTNDFTIKQHKKTKILRQKSIGIITNQNDAILKLFYRVSIPISLTL